MPEGLSTDRVRRTAQLARMGARTGTDFVGMKARGALASEERREELRAEFELRSAEQVAEALGNMKGAMMKLGQMASYLDQGLPEPVREALAQLQADAPPMSYELVEQMGLYYAMWRQQIGERRVAPVPVGVAMSAR